MLAAYLHPPWTVLSMFYSHPLAAHLTFCLSVSLLLFIAGPSSAAETKLDISLLVSRLLPLH